MTKTLTHIAKDSENDPADCNSDTRPIATWAEAFAADLERVRKELAEREREEENS